MPFIIRFRLICAGQTAHVCVCGWYVWQVCVCVLCVCGVCAAWRQMLKTKPQQAQRSRRLIKMCSQLQRALRRAVGVPRGVVCGIKVPQCAQARKWKGKGATEAKRPQQNGRAVGQLASRKTDVRGGKRRGKGWHNKRFACLAVPEILTHAHTCSCTCTNLHVRCMQKWNK